MSTSDWRTQWYAQAFCAGYGSDGHPSAVIDVAADNSQLPVSPRELHDNRLQDPLRRWRHHSLLPGISARPHSGVCNASIVTVAHV